MTTLKKLDALNEKRTQGEWVIDKDDPAPDGVCWLGLEGGTIHAAVGKVEGRYETLPDGEFIVALVDAWPKVREVIEAAKSIRRSGSTSKEWDRLMIALAALDEEAPDGE